MDIIEYMPEDEFVFEGDIDPFTAESSNPPGREQSASFTHSAEAKLSPEQIKEEVKQLMESVNRIQGGLAAGLELTTNIFTSEFSNQGLEIIGAKTNREALSILEQGKLPFLLLSSDKLRQSGLFPVPKLSLDDVEVNTFAIDGTYGKPGEINVMLYSSRLNQSRSMQGFAFTAEGYWKKRWGHSVIDKTSEEMTTHDVETVGVVLNTISSAVNHVFPSSTSEQNK